MCVCLCVPEPVGVTSVCVCVYVVKVKVKVKVRLQVHLNSKCVGVQVVSIEAINRSLIGRSAWAFDFWAKSDFLSLPYQINCCTDAVFHQCIPVFSYVKQQQKMLKLNGF